MSSVTRLRLLSQSMLNVTCQKQKHCSSLPTDKESVMESVGQPRPFGTCTLLGVPGLGTLDPEMDDDESEEVIGIRPKSSPLPRRRSSVSDEDSEPEVPLCGSRRVSFADAKGLSLVQVKEFDTWNVPNLPGYDSSESKGNDAEEYFLSPLTFSLPLSTEELFAKVQEQKVELETIELLPGTTILKGIIRVLNISFSKAVYVRTTLDTWSSHFDLLAEYIPGSSDNLTDCFSFKLTLVPPFGEQENRIDFCLRYETPVGTFWANNNNRNYVLFCQQRATRSKEKPKMENANKKSCLKTVSKNFFTVEINSAVDDPSQENVSTDVSKHEEKVDTVKAKQILDDQSGTSDKDGQKFLVESQLNHSRRNRRKAARMARVRDFFAQRGGEANGMARDKSPPETRHPVQEEAPEEKHSDMQSLSEGSSKSKGSYFVYQSLETCNTPAFDVQYYTSPAHEPEKSESFSLTNTTPFKGGEGATDIRDNPLLPNDDYAPAECQNINKSVSKAEESGQGSYKCISNIGAEPAESVVLANNSESLVGMANSFTFGTMVYHQMSSSDLGNPVQATLHVGDSSQRSPYVDSGETSCTAPADNKGNKDKVHGNVIKPQESEPEYLLATLNNSPAEEEETSLSVTENCVVDSAEILQDTGILSDQRCTSISVIPKATLGNTEERPHNVNVLKADPNPKIPTENLQLQGEAQEDDVNLDLQSQPATEVTWAQLSGNACTQSITNLHETHESDRQVISKLELSFMSLQPSQRGPEGVSDETEKQDSSSPSNGCKCVSLKSHEESHDVEEENKEAMVSNYKLGDTSVEEVLKCEEKVVSEEIEHHEMEAAVSRQEILCLTHTNEVKNWELMAEEEEKNTLTDEEKSQAKSLKAEDNEIIEKDQGEELEDAEIETESANIDRTEMEKEKACDKMIGMITAAREKDTDPLQDKEWNGEEQIWDIVAGKEREEVLKELQPVSVINKDGEEKLNEETTEREKKDEQEGIEKEKHSAELHKVIIERINVQEVEEEIEGEGAMEIDFGREENTEEENTDYKQEIVVNQTSVTFDAELESMREGYRGNEVGCFEERLDITGNKAEDNLSAVVNDTQDKSVTVKGNTGEGQTKLYKEEAFHNNMSITHGPSKASRDEAKCAAAGGGSSVLAEELESDQLSRDGTSEESGSDDEVELYMHCLKAVHAGAQDRKDKNRDAGLTVGKGVGFPASRSKLQSTPMPSISEDEEQPLGHIDTKTANVQTGAAALPASSGQGGINRNISGWIESFSCSSISKTLLCATLLVLFLVVAYHYDFLACFGLYVISVIWLCCQGERQPVKNNRIG